MHRPSVIMATTDIFINSIMEEQRSQVRQLFNAADPELRSTLDDLVALVDNLAVYVGVYSDKDGNLSIYNTYDRSALGHRVGSAFSSLSDHIGIIIKYTDDIITTLIKLRSIAEVRAAEIMEAIAVVIDYTTQCLDQTNNLIREYNDLIASSDQRWSIFSIIAVSSIVIGLVATCPWLYKRWSNSSS